QPGLHFFHATDTCLSSSRHMAWLSCVPVPPGEYKMTQQHKRRPAGRPDADTIRANEPVRSASSAPAMERLLQARISRRAALRGSLGLAATTVFAGAGVATSRAVADTGTETGP